MKPPLRWKDSAGADPVASALLRAGRRTEPMPAASRQRGARHAAALGLLPVASVGLWSKGVVAAFGVGFGGALALVSVSPALRAMLAPPEPLSAPIVVRAPARAAPSPVVAPLAAASAAASPPAATLDRPPAPRAPARGRLPVAAPEADAVVASSAGAEPGERGISAELELLLVARQRLASDAAGALLLLDRHRAAFPAGTLGMEREILTIDALARAGQREAARHKANALLAEPGNAFYADRLKQLLSSL